MSRCSIGRLQASNVIVSYGTRERYDNEVVMYTQESIGNSEWPVGFLVDGMVRRRCDVGAVVACRGQTQPPQK